MTVIIGYKRCRNKDAARARTSASPESLLLCRGGLWRDASDQDLVAGCRHIGNVQ